MFPEMAEEFNAREFDQYKDIIIPMNQKVDDDENGETYYYEFELEIPYGELKYNYLFKNKKASDEERQDLPAS